MDTLNGLKEALALIQQTAVEAKTPTIVDVPGDPTRYAIHHDGQILFSDRVPDRRKHACLDIAAIVGYAHSNAKGVLWHDHMEITLVCDDVTRRDLVTMRLTPSPAISTLANHTDEMIPLNGAELIALLRLRLGITDAAILAPFRALDWTAIRTEDTGSTKLRRSDVAEVASKAPLPASVNVPVLVYDNMELADLPQTVKCLIEFQPVEKKILLVPEPGAVARAIEVTHGHIGERLRKAVPKSIPVYYGSANIDQPDK